MCIRDRCNTQHNMPELIFIMEKGTDLFCANLKTLDACCCFCCCVVRPYPQLKEVEKVVITKCEDAPPQPSRALTVGWPLPNSKQPSCSSSSLKATLL